MSIKPDSLKTLLYRLWQQINTRRRFQLGLLLILTLLASLAEIISIGAVIPFIGIISNPESIFKNNALKVFIDAFHFKDSGELIFPITIFFIFAIVFAGVTRLVLLWVNTRLAFAIGADLGINIYRRSLYQPYEVHCKRNSSDVIVGISSKTNLVINNVIISTLTFISSFIILLLVLFAIFAINIIVALTTFIGIGVIYIFIISLTRNKLSQGSKKIAHQSTRVVKLLQEGLGGIRDILIDGSQETYSGLFFKADRSLRLAQAINNFISLSPRYLLEVIGMVILALSAYLFSQNESGVISALPILGSFALGAQRLLPLTQQIYTSLTQIQGGVASLSDVLLLLEQPLPKYLEKPTEHEPVFKNQIQLSKVYFSYSSAPPWTLKNINLTIPLGSRIGIIGTTGSGKSTLVDIIMGLLEPTEGELRIDDHVITRLNYRSWQQYIAHVPQSIYLADSTIAENIAFGTPKEKIDIPRLKMAAEQAQIAKTIEGWSKKYQTPVGERGIRLSGGQRQRIGIARALYKQAKVIVFDEATSALDTDTENAVMRSIENISSDITLIIIAHRLTTLKHCTKIIKLSSGKIEHTDVCLENVI